MKDFVKQKLLENADPEYQVFSAKLIPNINNVLGVRIPLLRKLAKTLYMSDEFKLDEFLEISDSEFMEFSMLQGVLIGLKKSDKDEFFSDIKSFVPKIDNWAICDIFCASLKLTKKYLKEMFEFLEYYLNSDEEYELRFGVVMLLTYYINDEYIDRVVSIMIKLKHQGYYAQMAIAWALSICYVKFFDKTHSYVAQSDIAPEILRRTVRKVVESLRPSVEQKTFLKEYAKNKLA